MAAKSEREQDAVLVGVRDGGGGTTKGDTSIMKVHGDEW